MVKFFTLTTCHSDSVTTWKKFSNNLKTAVIDASSMKCGDASVDESEDAAAHDGFIR